MKTLHSSLSVVVFLALLLLVYLPLPLRNYLAQCIEFVVYFQWLPLIAPAFWIFSWINNCNLLHLAGFWLSITLAPGLVVYTIVTKNGALPYGKEVKAQGVDEDDKPDCIDRRCPNGICGGRACADGFLRIWTGVAILAALFLAYWSYLVYKQGACPPGQTCSATDGLVARGLISQAQLNWWNDVLPLRISLVLMMIFEGWRVRMSFTRSFIYAALTMFGNGIGSTISVPLFIYQYRQMMRANDLAWWWCRTQQQVRASPNESVSSSASASASAPSSKQFAEEPVLPNGKVNMPLISGAVREYIAQGGSPSALAMDLLANQSPINSRRFPMLTAFGLNLPWEVVLIVMHIGVTLHSTYIWLAWLTQFEKNACWITVDQYQAFLHPAAFTMAFCPFLTFLPLMVMELTLGHFFLNAYDKRTGAVVTRVGWLLGVATAYYNNINVALVLGLFFGLRELRLRYGAVIVTMLNEADAKAAVSDPFPTGEQSVWYSSQAPNAYCSDPSVDIAKNSRRIESRSGAVAPIGLPDASVELIKSVDSSAAEVSSNLVSSPTSTLYQRPGKGKGKAPLAQTLTAGNDKDPRSQPNSASSGSSKSASSQTSCRFFHIIWASILVTARMVGTALSWFSSDVGAMFSNIGGWFVSIYVAWQRLVGWSPLPMPLHTQADFSQWSQLIVSFLVYYRALCLCVTLMLWSHNENSNMVTRWAMDVGAFIVATVIIFYDAKQAKVDTAGSQDAEKQLDRASTKTVFVSEFILSHPFVSAILLVLQVLAFLLATPMIDNDEQGYNYAFHNVRISLNNLIFNYDFVGANMALIGATVLGGVVLVFGTKCPMSRSNGSQLSWWRILLLVAPIILSLMFVWPSVVQPCYLQPGREFSTLKESELIANKWSTKQIVVERAFLNDTATSATRQPAVRAAHPKQHGCVKAKFSLPYTIPQKYRHGIFSDEIQPGLPLSSTGVKEWWSFVRMSNGLFQVPNGHGGWNLSPDSKADIRGMAVKVILRPNSTAPMSLSAEEIAQAQTDANTQDFVSINSDFFFAKNGEHFSGLSAASATSTPIQSVLEWIAPTEFSFRALRVSASKLAVTVGQLFRLNQLNHADENILNPLSTNYYSVTPYRMGPDQAQTAKQAGDALAVKYRWQPCQQQQATPFSAKQVIGIIYSKVAVGVNAIVSFLLRTPLTILPEVGTDTVYYRESMTKKQQPLSYLRINMQNSLNPFDSDGLAQPGCFQLLIQDQRDACENKIEDASKPWRGKWTPVARLDVPLQHFLSDAALEVCENLAFNPWHALAEHRPLGDINKIRKVAYLESAKVRLALNDQKPLGPIFTGDELPVVLYPLVRSQSDAAAPAPAVNASNSVDELFGNPALYSFKAYPAPWEGLPKMVGQVPHNETFSSFTQTMIASDLFHSIRAQVYAQPRIRDEMTKLQEFENIGLGGANERAYENSNHLPSGRMRRPALVDEAIWSSDSFFASNFIRGLNPMKIIKVTSKTPITKRLRVLSDDQKAQLATTLKGQGASTLDDLAAQGRLLFADYPEIDGLLTVENRILYSPVVVFYLTTGKRTLMPLLIQLENIRACPPEMNVTTGCVPVLPPVYFPSPWIPNLVGSNQTSAALTWMFAKMHVAHADAQVHQLISHLLETHLVMETTIIATHRALASSHVVFKLLSQHFAGTVAINEFGRMTLVSFVDPFVDVYQSIGFVGGMEIMTRRFHSPEYTFMETVPDQMARRGFKVPPAPATDWGGVDDEVPGFLYKDYSLPLWYLFRSYVRDALATDPAFATSKSEAAKTAAMQRDPQITAWFREMFDPLAGDLPLRNRADPRTSFSAFVDLLTQIIFQSSAQHAAINFPQYEFLAFQPVRPLALSRSMPRNPEDLTERFMVEALIDNGGLQLLQTTYDILSTCCVNTLTLDGSHSGGLLDAETTLVPSFPNLWAQLVTNLTQLETKEIKRNTDNNYAYPYLYPSRVPQSIAI